MNYKKAILELKNSALNNKIPEKDLLTGIDILLEVFADIANDNNSSLNKWLIYIDIHEKIEALIALCDREEKDGKNSKLV